MTNISNNIAKIAKQISEPARSAILIVLMQGKALTASEIGILADLSPQATSNHLSKLKGAGLITGIAAGRHRYYKIENPLVAQALESLSLLTDLKTIKPPGHTRISKKLCFARSCYDHLAGYLGVLIFDRLEQLNYIERDHESFFLTAKGCDFFKEKFQINIDLLTKQNRIFFRPCLDWTERSYHLGGGLGAALLDVILSNRWVLRSKEKRVLQLTSLGQTKLFELLQLRISAGSQRGQSPTDFQFFNFFMQLQQKTVGVGLRLICSRTFTLVHVPCVLYFF